MISATEQLSWVDPLTRFNTLNDGWSAFAWRAVSRALEATTLVVSGSGYLLAVEIADRHTVTPLVFLTPGASISSSLPTILSDEIERKLSMIDAESTSEVSVRTVEFDGRHYRLTMIPSTDQRSAIVVITVSDVLQANPVESGGFSLPALTNREQQILEMVANGHSNKQMASKLRLRPKTIEKHRSSLMRKLKARSVADLMRVWFRIHPETLGAPLESQAAAFEAQAAGEPDDLMLDDE